MKKIAVVDDFFNDNRRTRIQKAASDAGYTVDFYRKGTVPDEKWPEYEIVYGMPQSDDLKKMTSLKWFCASFAGVDRFMDESIYPSPDVILSNSSGAYGITISEHIIMVLLMLMRRMPGYISSSSQHEWKAPVPIQSIIGSEITVLGTGNIGTCFAQRAKALGARRVIGVRRTLAPAGEYFDETFSYDSLDEILMKAHILVSALPSTAQTRGLLNRQRLSLLPQDALLVNVGRGDVFDQDALVEILQSGKIAGAALDVMTPEPLPKEHPLWTLSNVIITPHISGNMSLPITCDIDVDLFCSDLKRFASGLLPERYVDRKIGY